MKTSTRIPIIQTGLVVAGLVIMASAAMAQEGSEMHMPEMSSHDIYWLFNRYWWLIFPIFGMITGLLHMNQRHDQSNRMLDMIKTYADQGKEAPPELLAALRDPNFGRSGGWRPNWIPVFLFAGLTVGFLLFSIRPDESGFEPRVPFLFVALVMASLSVGSLVNVLRQEKRDRNLPR